MADLLTVIQVEGLLLTIPRYHAEDRGAHRTQRLFRLTGRILPAIDLRDSLRRYSYLNVRRQGKRFATGCRAKTLLMLVATGDRDDGVLL